MKALLLLLLAPLAAQAQLALFALNGTTQTAVGSSYQFGQVPLNTTLTVEFQVYNAGTAPVTVNAPTLMGTAFTFASSPPPSYTILPKSAAPENISVSFTPTSAVSCNVTCSANFQIGSLSVILVGSGIAAPTLTSVSGCTGGGPFNFGSVTVGSSTTCTFSLQNLNPQAVTVTNVVVNGLGFAGPFGITTPLTLQPGPPISFSVTFTPPGPLAYSGTIAVGAQSYGLSGTGSAVLPSPSLTFDPGPFTSGQQRVLTMTIPGGAPIAASGNVTIAFKPSTPVVAGDSTIFFVAGSVRTIPFTVSAGATAVLLNGQSSATFQTGTTEGTITFTVSSAEIPGSPPMTTITIPGAPVIVESATASQQVLGSLVITVTGADNTYSTSTMSFSFFDTNGNPIGSAVPANFAEAFKNYYATVDGAGSTFMAQVTFPVVGSTAKIGTVTVTLTNAAGIANTGSLTFQ
jgi:hypothetical protein